MSGRIPDSYLHARLRAVLPICPETTTMGLAFDALGMTIRVRLGLEDAQQLVEVLGDYLRAHSERASGSPALEESAPLEGDQV